MEKWHAGMIKGVVISVVGGVIVVVIAAYLINPNAPPPKSPTPSVPGNSVQVIIGNVNGNSGPVIIAPQQGGKQDVSDDPRKELQNIGVAWNGKNFLDAVSVGDERVVALFLNGGMRPESAESDGRSLAIMLALNEDNPEQMLRLLLKHGLNVNHQFAQHAVFGEMKTTLLGSAIERGNDKLVSALVSNHAETNTSVQTYGAMGASVEMFPLQSAIYWKHSEIAILLINAKTDISVGDYAAYRQASSMKNDPYWKARSSEFNQILHLTAPQAGQAKRINTELRINEINAELNEVAKKSLQSYLNPYKKNQYDQRYGALQNEKKTLLSSLGRN